MSTKQPAENLHRHTVRELSFILRNRALWPGGFEWNYTDCRRCAMGLAFRLGMVTSRNFYEMASAFNMPMEKAYGIFVKAILYLPVRRMSDITPEHIADLLDAYADRALEGEW